MNCRDAALLYARSGWPVLPLNGLSSGRCSCGNKECSSPAKHPLSKLVSNGLKDANTDAEVLAEWWKVSPLANVGLRTGDAFDVLDVDGKEGRKILEDFEKKHGSLSVPRAITGGGGMHLFFAPSGIGNRARFAPGLDWRGKGGYIVAPPSIHISGNHYAWLDERPPTDFSKVPGWLGSILQPPRIDRGPTGRAVLPASGGTRYGLGALEAELAELARAAVGTRNHTL